jgi:hypothetical protein
MKYSAGEQTIAWFKDRYLEGSLEIRPPYQRRPVWALRQKSNLVESILMGLPIPEIYVHTFTSETGKTTYAVVDGQQRVRTILQFIGLDRDEGEQDENKFSLSDLASDSPWRGFTFEDLTPAQKMAFYGHQLAVRSLSNSTDEEIRDLFRRLNTYLTKLNDQELRNATYSGPFVALVNKLADEDYWAENQLVSAAMIRRMKDIEFVSELLIGIMDGPQGGATGVIDEYYFQLEQYSDDFPDQSEVERLYNQTFAVVRSLFPDLRVTRWKNRTDFYSLFIAVAHLLRSRTLPITRLAELKTQLDAFVAFIREYMDDETADVPEEIKDYVGAVQRGSSDRSRRAVRHRVLTNSIEAYFVLKA